MKTSSLSPYSIELSVRIISNLIKHSFEGQKEMFDGKALIKVFLSLGDENSFIRQQGGTLSGSYCCKIIFTCSRVLDYLKYHYEELPRAQEADCALKNLLKRYQKVEKVRVTSREESWECAVQRRNQKHPKLSRCKSGSSEHCQLP